MKKVSISLMMGRKTRCYIRTIYPPAIYIFATLPVGQASKSPPLGPKLGQFGLNAESLCDEFNKTSLAVWKSQLKIPTVIFVTPSKTYVLENQFPSVYSLTDTVFSVGTKQKAGKRLPKVKKVLLRTIYKIAIVISRSKKKKILFRTVCEVCGSFRSYQLFLYNRKKKYRFNFKKKKK